MTGDYNYFPTDALQQPSDDEFQIKAASLAAELARIAQHTDTLAVADTQPITIYKHELSPRSNSYSIACESHPERNEDSYFSVDKPGAVLAGGVFDGIGGNPGSERASQLVAETVNRFFDLLTTDVMLPENAALFAEDLLIAANREIRFDTRLNIATTAAIASIHTNPTTAERFVSIAWAGDSRVYVIRNGKIVYRTLDDGVPMPIPELDELYAHEAPEYRAQAFLESTVRQPGGELSRIFHYRNLIDNFLAGTSDLKVHTMAIPVESGDIILASSDGIHDNLTNSEILSIINTGGGTKELANAAVARSHDESHIRAKRDDMTSVVFVA